MINLFVKHKTKSIIRLLLLLLWKQKEIHIIDFNYLCYVRVIELISLITTLRQTSFFY